MKDLVGKEFGSWTVLAHSPFRYKYDHRRWICRCSCGIEKPVNESSLIAGTSTRCKACNYKAKKPNTALNGIFNKYKGHATECDRVFNLTLEELATLIQLPCHYCGRLPFRAYKGGGPVKYDFVYNGIDRKDNEIGYVLSNCLPCCLDCNIAKRDRSYEEYVDWVLASADHLRKDT